MKLPNTRSPAGSVKKLAAVIVGALGILLLCGAGPATDKQTGSVYEAEQAVLLGHSQIVEDEDASDGKAVIVYAKLDEGVAFQVDIAQDGFYDLVFTGKGFEHDKLDYVFVDDRQLSELRLPEDGGYGTRVMPKTPLSAGSHEISVRVRRGNFYLDCLTVIPTDPIPESFYDVSPTLTNPKATEETRELFRFLCDCYGRYTLSGQHCPGGLNGEEMQAIHSVTGEYPAILSMDIRDYSESRTYFGAVGNTVEHALEFHRAGGIVSFCWHWNAPAQTILPSGEKGSDPAWHQGYRENNSFFNILRVMHGDEPDLKRALDMDIQAVAAQLKHLEEEGVPVLWRPLHEASGGWFWWGADGPDAFKQLWIYLYKTLTEVYRCNNLIWVCTCLDAEWYPGDEYVDILGDDIYTLPRQYGPQIRNFLALHDCSPAGRMLALTETGSLPDVDEGFAANVRWSWFCGWEYGYVVKDGAYSPEYTEEDMLRKIYGSEHVLNLEDIKRLRN